MQELYSMMADGGDLRGMIETINEEIMESFEIRKELQYSPIIYQTDGYEETISFYGYELWSSEVEDLDRGYDEKTDAYEPMESFIRRRIDWFVEQISKIKVNED